MPAQKARRDLRPEEPPGPIARVGWFRCGQIDLKGDEWANTYAYRDGEAGVKGSVEMRASCVGCGGQRVLRERLSAIRQGVEDLGVSTAAMDGEAKR